MSDFGRWLPHGGPCTWKSRVIKLVMELFEEVLGWAMTVQLQAVALQAVTAQQLGGSTIHHACDIPENKKAVHSNVVERERPTLGRHGRKASRRCTRLGPAEETWLGSRARLAY